MTLGALVQLVASCMGIVGSLFFAIGVVRQTVEAMARLSHSYWDANPHMPAVLAAQKADYVFGGGMILVAFALQLGSFFAVSTASVLSEGQATAAPWVAAALTALFFFALRLVSIRLARHYEQQVRAWLEKEYEEEERKLKPEREARENAT
jgi:hypothetical protein